jgi:hypothetical protein
VKSLLLDLVLAGAQNPTRSFQAGIIAFCSAGMGLEFGWEAALDAGSVKMFNAGPETLNRNQFAQPHSNI